MLPEHDMRFRILALLALVAIVVGVIVTAALLRGPTKIHVTGVFNFQYPREWDRLEVTELPFTEQAGYVAVSRDTFGPEGRDDWVAVSSRPIDFRLTEAGIPRLIADTRRQFDELQRRLPGVRQLEPPSPLRRGGMLGYTARIAGVSPTGGQVEDRLTRLHRGRTAYQFVCQHRVDGGRRRVIGAGCDTMIGTLQAKGR